MVSGVESMINQNEKYFSNEVIDTLKVDGVGVIPTDTIYGIVGSALNKEAVKRIKELKGRSANKPFIILIGKISDLDLFDINLNLKIKSKLKKVWPAKVSVILPCENDKFEYLHLGLKSLAFRIPDDKELRDLLSKTGPLVAPSANPEGKVPAATIADAQKYFSDLVDFYVDGEIQKSRPSKLIKFEDDGRVTVLR